jgi:hypothetical protein
MGEDQNLGTAVISSEKAPRPDRLTQSQQEMVPLSIPAGTVGPSSNIPPLTAMRLRWIWLLVAGILGATLGGVAAGHQGQIASASLQVTNTSQDSQLAKQDAETVAREAESPRVLTAAAKTPGIQSSDLGGRVSGVSDQKTNLVKVSVNASSGVQAVALDNAVVDAVVQFRQADLASRMAEIRDQTAEVLRRDTLTDVAAEDARRAQLGTGLGQQQSALTVSAGSVQVFEHATAAGPAGIGRSLAAAFGSAAGVLLAGAGVVLVGVGGRLGSVQQLTALAPDLTVRTPNHVAEFAGRLLDSGGTYLAVLALPGGRLPALGLAAEVADQLRLEKLTVALIDATSSADDRSRVLQRHAHVELATALESDVIVATIDADDVSLAMLARRTTLMVIVVALRRKNSLRQVRHVVRELDSANPTVVLAG